MSEAKHTPAPWQLCAHLAKHDECTCGYRGSIWGADEETIVCEMGSSPDIDNEGRVAGHCQPQADRPTQLADAAFIVRAVNAHDDLVEALRGLIEACTAEFNEKGAGGYALARLSDARTALAKAESS